MVAQLALAKDKRTDNEVIVIWIKCCMCVRPTGVVQAIHALPYVAGADFRCHGHRYGLIAAVFDVGIIVSACSFGSHQPTFGTVSSAMQERAQRFTAKSLPPALKLL